ncbi:MAG: flavin reductase family protein [Nanoarchaeota archaeon]|nr:flavin reductase family protein [Nanoarchaeota archaeon]
MSEITSPRQSVLVTSRAVIDSNIKDDIITLDWHMPASFSPQLYAISVGKTRFSHKMIRSSGVFVVNFMPFHLYNEVLYCGRHSGEFEDKFKESGLIKEEAEKIDCCKVKEAIAFLECEVISEIDSGDHTIFIGRVVKDGLKHDAKRVFHKSGDKFITTTD